MQQVPGGISKSCLSKNKWEKSDLSKGLYIYDDHSIDGEGGGGGFLKLVTILYFGCRGKKIDLFCECHKWVTPSLSHWNNLAVKQDPGDHDPGHQRYKTKSCSVFKSAESHESLLESPNK